MRNLSELTQWSKMLGRGICISNICTTKQILKLLNLCTVDIHFLLNIWELPFFRAASHVSRLAAITHDPRPSMSSQTSQVLTVSLQIFSPPFLLLHINIIFQCFLRQATDNNFLLSNFGNALSKLENKVDNNMVHPDSTNVLKEILSIKLGLPKQIKNKS